MDDVMAWMEKYGIPVTRDNYIEVAFMGSGLPEGYDEDDLPEEVRKGRTTRNPDGNRNDRDT